MIDGSGGLRPCWSSSTATVLNPEPAAPCATSVASLPDDVRSHKDFGVFTVPARLRDSPGRQLVLGWWSLFGLALLCTFVSANLYYCQPLPIEMANSFQQSYGALAWMPTMYEAGYCVGLFFISPLGDLVRRRQLVLTLVGITTCLSVGLALATNLLAYRILAVLIGVFNVTPQILLPLAADLAAPPHRASAVSMLQSGVMLGTLLARFLGGVISYFTTWRAVYYVASGLQALVLCGAYWIVPDCPPKNPQLTYPAILRSMLTYAVTEPMLVQAALINLASIACWTNFWVTLTFLLDDEPYHFSTLWIGLFGLIGVLGIFSAPLAARFIDGFGAWHVVLISTLCLLVFQGLETAAGGLSIAVVAIVCFGVDAGRQTQTVSLQTIVFDISEEARSRLNALLTFSLFAGQVIGSSVGASVFLRYGWRAAAALSVGLYGWQLVVLFARGPNCGRHVWFGHQGGFGVGQRRCLDDGHHSGCAQPHAAEQGNRTGSVHRGPETDTETDTGTETETELKRQATADTCVTGEADMIWGIAV